MKPLLSILTPAIPRRAADVAALQAKLGNQIGDLPVEHLVFTDNCKRTVGEKRDALLRLARGEYVAFVDDDDDISDDYLSNVLKGASSAPKPDVITFRQHATVNGLEADIEFKLGNPNEQFTPGTLVKRNAWHVCAWRRTLAIQSQFPTSNYGEDWAFAGPLCGIPNLVEYHIPLALHFYRHDIHLTAAPP